MQTDASEDTEMMSVWAEDSTYHHLAGWALNVASENRLRGPRRAGLPGPTQGTEWPGLA